MSGKPLFAAALLVSLLGLLRTEARAGDGVQMLRILPDNMALVATWNTARSRLGPTGLALLDAVAQNPRLDRDVQRLRAQANIDWKRDVDTVVLGLAGNFDKSGRFVLVVEGRFTRDALIAAARKGKGFAARQHQGIAYYQSGRVELAFLGEHWVTTRKGAMPQVINVFQGKARSLEQNRRIQGLLRTADVTKDMWYVFTVPEPMQREIAEQAGGHTITQGVGSVDLQDFNKETRARMRLGMSSRAGVIAMGPLLRIQGAQDETIQAMGLSQAVRTMNVSRKDNNLDMTLRPSRADMKKLGQFLRTWSPSSP